VAVVSAGPTTRQILATLGQHPGSTLAELAESVGRSVDYVRQALDRPLLDGDAHAARDWTMTHGPLRYVLIRMPALSIPGRVLAVLADGGMTAADLAPRIQARERSVRRALTSLEQHGQIEVVYGSRPLVFTLAQQAAK